MSYQVLARKWRPKDFSETVGQEHVLKALTNALDSERLHHAYLFTGTRGVGKTTIARILAKSLNCETGVTSQPCGTCSACVEIDEGRFVDLIEVDGASRTKVDDTRDLLDNVQFAAAHGRYKVYLIDEVHMLSNHSFNALLKTLEEPPEHVKFLLATTDPHKLPVTVLSRCLQFNLTRMTPRLISERLEHICGAEGIKSETAALALLARAADGSMRDALSLLDMAISYCGGDSVVEDATSTMLGTVSRDHVVRLLRLLSERDAAGIVALLREFDALFPDYGRLLEDLARDLQRIAVYQVVGTVGSEDIEEDSTVAELAPSFSAADVQLYYQIALLGRRDLHLAPDPRSGAEMTLLRMLAFRPAGEAGNSSSGTGGANAGRQRNPAGAPPVKQPQAAAAPDVAGAAIDWAEPDWPALVEKLSLSGAVRMLAGNCAFDRFDDGTVYLSLDPRSESLLTKARQNELAKRLSDHLGSATRVEIAVGAASKRETPVQQESRIADEQLEAARQSLESDPNVQTLKHMFGAELKPDTIEVIPGEKT